ncbi:VWA domain-containing protein [Streptomyces sp. 549]|uniref:VWA domain-containing protein n=1 Tax=Streptomyces sp. 549 TaxID=3049076 RepID=UPI0024C4399D|nr:VWA domain-containing protein [Streptomyces sp. 549]MDK1474167.1 VWA domain-containing protein [Streptomyces sp. 549]
MIIGRRSTGVLCGLLATMAVWALPSSAAAEPAEPDTPQVPPKVELVLDVSGSMSKRDVDGGSRMAAAKRAFNDVIDAVPEGVHMGIRTLGANYKGDDKARGCVDSEQLYPVGEVDRREAKTAVATLAPTGWTPIGFALRGAAKDLGTGEGTRRIVLITDGEDSCGLPDPCDVARELAAAGTQLTVDTLGLAGDAKVREQLSCIAEATGGTYTAVQRTDELSDRLKQLVRRSVDTPVENPAPAEGADRCATAPELTAGVYTDRAEFGQHRWYRVELKPGEELRASVSVAADRAVDRDYSVLLRAVTERGRELVRGAEAGHGRTDVMSTGLRYPWTGDEERVVCLEASHSFSAPESVPTSPGMPVELTVDVVEAPSGAGDAAYFGLARGWVPLVLLTLTGLAAGALAGLLGRLRRPVRGAN